MVRALRPRNEDCKEPRRQGQRPKITIQSYLDALSVMRIRKHERNQWKRLKLVAEVCGYKGCVEEAAAYKERRKQWLRSEPISKVAKVEMSRARSKARAFFQSFFPREEPLNH